MIRFFRHFRQRMIVDKRFSKYLLYAFGEIVLVVIGILIAFNINSWNESRKAKLQEIQILSQLKDDLEANLFEVKDIYSTSMRRLISCDSIIDYLINRRPTDDSLKVYFETIDVDALFNCSNTTYQYIQSQGTNFLRNDSLRNKITNIYEFHFQNIFTRQALTWQIVQNDLRPAFDRQFKFGPSIGKDGTDKYAVNTPKNLDSLYEDEAFHNVIVRLRTMLGIRTKWLPGTISKLETLINEIQLEIDRLS